MKRTIPRTDYSGCTIANFVILTLRELDHEFRDLVIHFHALQDSCAIVGDSDFAFAPQNKSAMFSVA